MSFMHGWLGSSPQPRFYFYRVISGWEYCRSSSICGRREYCWAEMSLVRLVYIFLLCARFICRRKYSWSGYTWAGVLLERLIYILYHVYVGGNVARAVDLYIVSCARKLNVGGSVVGSVKYGRESCWSG